MLQLWRLPVEESIRQHSHADICWRMLLLAMVLTRREGEHTRLYVPGP